MNIYVGNLSYSVTEEQLKGLFEEFGQVASAKIITDKFTSSPRGFAFVEMPLMDEAQQAIDNLNGKDFHERKLMVNKARPPKKTSRY
ncbi:MAG: RNA-binding protein [Candidatus Babeliales bacterium]